MQKKEKIGVIIKILIFLPLILIGAFVLLIIIAFIVSAFNKKHTEKERIAKSELGRQNAVSYIKNKYDIDAEVVDANVDKFHSFMTEKDLDTVTVKMNDGKKDFYVNIDGTKKTDHGYDNYQWDEIQQAVVDKIDKFYPGGCLVQLGIDRDKGAYFSEDEFFNGSNLDDFFSAGGNRLVMYFVNTEFNDCSLFDEFSNWDFELRFVSFDTEERIDEFRTDMNGTADEYFRCYAPYITDMWEIDHGKSQRVSFELRDAGDFLYYCPYLKEDEDVEISETDGEKLAEESRIYHQGHGNAGSTPVSKGYVISAEAPVTIYIYMPLDSIENSDKHCIRCTYKNNKSNTFLDPGVYCVGDYGVFHIDGKEPEFVLIDTGWDL